MFLRLILIILIIYLFVRLVSRILAPFMIKKMVDKAQRHFEEQFQNPYYKDEKTEPGKTYIDKKKSARKVEDADFEELE